jgi:ABC-type branched-subunit amino acid transport system substrate-binding protein
VLATAVLATAAMAGCGGAGRTADGPALSPLESAPPPPGAPVKVMIWAPQDTVSSIAFPDLPMVAQAFADLTNVQGGVNGRPLVVLSCDEGGEAAGAERCAREAVQEKVLAVVGSYSTHAGAYLPILQAAGIAYLGGAPLGPGDLTDPVAFPITGGPALLVAGAARLAAMQGCRRAALVHQDSAPAALLERYTWAGLVGGGAGLVSTTELPSGPGSLADEVGRATRDSDCVVLATSDQGTQRFLAGYQQQGADQQLYTIGGGQTVGVAAQFPELRARTFLTESLPPGSNGAWRRYREALAQWPGGDRIDASGTVQRQTWTAFEVFLQVARQLTRFDSASMLAALRGSNAVDTGGLTPALDFTREAPLPGLNRLFNPRVTYQTFEDGRFTELRPGFQDLTPVLAAATGR